MRIVHAVRSDGFAGVESHIARLAVGQARAGHRVAVIGGDPEAMRQAMAGADVRQRPAATASEVVRGLDAYRHSDILHVHMTAAEAAAVAAVRAWPRPVVTTRHFAAHRGATRRGRLAATLVARRIAAQIAISEYVAAAVEGDSVVVPPGLPAAPVVPASERTRTVLVAQRLEAEKRTQDAIEIFARSGLLQRGWRLAIAGDGARRAHLGDTARRWGVAAATDFLGHRRDVPELMRTAGLLIAPCDIEGLGLTVVEAMAVGLPVVACAAGGHLETVGAAAAGALYPVGDLSAGADLVRCLAVDDERRVAYGAELAQIQSTRFTVEAQVAGVDAVYRAVLS